MTTLAYAGAQQSGAAAREADQAARASRRWRTIWRTHFYAGVFAAPFLVLMALTGLVILYTQPLQTLLQGDLRTVADTGEWVSFDRQEAAVAAAYPDVAINSVVVPRNATTSASFGLEDGREVFVDPYSAEVLGDWKSGSDIVALANRLHGYANFNAIKVPIPGLTGFWGEGWTRDCDLGDVLLEVFGCWTLVLAVSGIYLWLPRKRGTGRGLFTVRLGKKGRARWRDLHAVPGVALFALLGFTLVSGMPWSAYWGENFRFLANKVTPNQWVDAPNSTVAKLGDLDRLGHQINWNMGDAAIPNSSAATATAIGAERPARVSLQTVVEAASEEGMLPGYSISYPNDGDDAGAPTYGSFTLSNSWPRHTGESRTLYLDQFSGKTLSSMGSEGFGTVSYAQDLAVSTHMGTQLGIVSRIFMTLLCVLTLWSVFSAAVMYTRRRRPGTLGLPKRPRSLRLANGLIAITVVLAIIYPLWGASAAAILAFDRFVIRKVPPLRAAFGQP